MLRAATEACGARLGVDAGGAQTYQSRYTRFHRICHSAENRYPPSCPCARIGRRCVGGGALGLQASRCDVRVVRVAEGLKGDGIAEPAAAPASGQRPRGGFCKGTQQLEAAWLGGEMLCAGRRLRFDCMLEKTQRAHASPPRASDVRMLEILTCWLGCCGDLPCSHVFP